MGIMFVYQDAGQIDGVWSALPWFTISLSLNILLTLMIVVRLILHTRSCRTALGITGIGGLCKAIITMLVESCALYAVGSALLIGSLGGDTYVANFFLFILPETQVGAFSHRRSQSLDAERGNWTGHRSAAHHSTSRRKERVREQYSRIWAYR